MARILHVLSQIPSQTGSGVFFENLIRQCERFGYRQAAVIGLPQDLQGYPIDGIEKNQIHEVLFETEDLPFKIPGMSDVMPYASTVFSAMDQERFDRYRRCFKEAANKVISEFRPDVVLSNHLWVATAAVCEAIAEISSECRPKLFAVCHGTDIRQMQLAPLMREFVTAGCAKADGIFSLNRHQAEAIQQLYQIPPERVHLIGTGYDGTMFHRAPAEQERTSGKTELVYAGKLSESKGLMELIRCMHRLDPERFRLTIAGRGSGPEADSILRAIAEPGADIRYVGHLPQEELAALFRKSDTFVLPSYYEGLPLVVIEALASGMRVVVNDLRGLREWLGDTINDSGRVFYVRMPALKGLDTCAPEAAPSYIEDLASALMRCSCFVNGSRDSLQSYYSAIEEKSWANVFMRMERVFQASQ